MYQYAINLFFLKNLHVSPKSYLLNTHRLLLNNFVYFDDLWLFHKNLVYTVYKMDCKYSTTTSSGTFTVYNQLLHKCTATKFCKEKGHILAPITTLEDKEALTKLLHPYCDIHKNMTKNFLFYI